MCFGVSRCLRLVDGGSKLLVVMEWEEKNFLERKF